MKLRKGDIVGRVSYDKDIYFFISDIININNKHIAILKGLIIRIEADSPLNDLEKISDDEVIEALKKFDKDIECKQKNNKTKKSKIERNCIRYGKILHLDGDKKYSEKSQKFYKSLGLNVTVKNIPENRQPKVIYSLLSKYNPDILVITRT